MLGPLAFAVIAVVAVVYMDRPVPTPPASWNPLERAAPSGRRMGYLDAPVTMVKYEDFQCLLCQAFTHDSEPTLVKDYVNKGVLQVEVVPFSVLGEESITAAEAAECASDQGRFWEYHDLLFLRQGRPNSGTFKPEKLRGFARELASKASPFDVLTFDRCLASGEKRMVVEILADRARRAGVSTTPAFTINGEGVNGSQPLATFEQAIDRALREAGAR